jgi:hypothetical protein
MRWTEMVVAGFFMIGFGLWESDLQRRKTSKQMLDIHRHSGFADPSHQTEFVLSGVAQPSGIGG